MSRTIYLCGFMGCGKTTVGTLLAKKLGCSYTDMDSYITETEGMSIPEIFSSKGEPYFREKETQAVEALGRKGGVIACGGGAMLKDINAEKAAENGIVVYIDTPYDICYDRIKGDKNRPIVMANTKESLKEIFDSRVPLYKAHSQICAEGNGTPDEIASEIAAAVNNI
ncbi:MAG: shikimate kinase [Huintestinicola sp.]